MKSIQGTIISSVLIVCLLSLTGCPEPPGPTETESQKAAKLLADGAWNLQSVSVDGVDKTSVYQGLKVDFNLSGTDAIGGTFSTTTGRAAWPATGSWSFDDDFGATIERNDGLSITVEEVTESNLVLGLVWDKTTYGNGGRVGSVSGQHTFTFTH